MNYGNAECDITEGGRPTPRCGNVFVSVHGGRSSNSARRNLDEQFGFSVTLTMRVTISMDRIGDQLIARNLALVPLAQRQGFNAKAEQLRAFLHQNWGMTVLTGQTPPSANDNLVAWATGAATTVYGFVEPAHYASGIDTPVLVGADWMGADPDSVEFAIKAELRFDGARRMQAQTASVGPNV
jgi:hypothetical protein